MTRISSYVKLVHRYHHQSIQNIWNTNDYITISGCDCTATFHIW